MNKLRLLFAGMAMMAVPGAMAATSDQVLYDFESGLNGFGSGGWGQTVTLEANPYSCGNTSSQCVKIVTEGYGCAGISGSFDIGNYVVAVDAFSYNDVQVRCNESYEHGVDLNASAQAKKWTTLYFDFRNASPNKTATSLVFGAVGETGTVYIDNIRLVGAVGVNYDCDPMAAEPDVDYTFGRLQIGGGGFVSGLLTEGNVKLARTDVGGAYKWNSSNCQWEQMFDFISPSNIGLLSVEAMAIDPNNTDNMYFLCGCQYYSSQKTSVLYTRDGGKTFKESEVTNVPLYVHGNGDGRNAGERIAVDPNNSNILLAGGRAGTPVIISSDAGVTWKALSGFPNVYTTSVKWPSWVDNSQPTTENNNGVSAIVFDGSSKLSNGNTGRIFVGVSRTGADNLYMSEDGGASWKAITIDQNKLVVRMKMDGQGNLIVTMADKFWGASSGSIYRYDIAAGTSSNISPSTLACSDVAIRPSDPNYMVTSTNNTWIPQAWDNGKSANGDIIWVTKDGGKNWTSLQDKMVLTNNGVTWVPGYALHWCGGICIDPENENKASFTSGNGIWTCDNIWEILDDASAKPVIYFDVQGVEETVPLDFISIEGKSPMSVIGDYTGFVHNSVSDYAPIHDPAPGTTYGIGYAALNSDIIARVCASEYSSQESYITTNGGRSWSSMGNVAAYHVGFNADGSKIFVTTKDGALKYSADNGSSWNNTTVTTNASYVTGDPVNSNYVYATASYHNDSWVNIVDFYVSSDAGATWNKTYSAEGTGYGRMAVVPGHEGVIYLAHATNGVMVSTDHGATFTKVGLSSCSGVGVGKGKTADSYTLYAFGGSETAEGVFRSTDKGATWQLTSDNKHMFGGLGNGQFIVGDMNVFGRYYMSTTGMGIVYADETANFEAPVYKCKDGSSTAVEAIDAVSGDNLNVYPNPTSGSFSLNESGELVIVNTLGSVVFNGSYAAGEEIGGDLPAGIYVARINGKVQKIVKK